MVHAPWGVAHARLARTISLRRRGLVAGALWCSTAVVGDANGRWMAGQMMRGRWAVAMALWFAMACLLSPAQGASLKILTAGAFRQVLVVGEPQLAAAAGASVEIAADTVGGLIRRVSAGEPFDVLIASPEALEALRSSGAIAGQIVDLARVGVGVGVRDGAERPALDSVADFREALLKARAVAYVDPAAGGTSGVYLSILFDQLGIGPQMRAKAVLVRGGNAADRVVSGEADLALQQISEILPVKGVVLAGPLPAEIQRYTTYSVVVARTAAQLTAAQAAITWLRGAEAADIIRARGMEPVPPATTR
ncbi:MULTISPECIES: substrate-binding domain-containing protein [unclassified Bradyrhizobium]|uniref:molybdate ABC transporter substrate-binding protein n=1 Tax=unclassified Bradyrhizobium TaxID=2631580 RepID=UPI0032E37463